LRCSCWKFHQKSKNKYEHWLSVIAVHSPLFSFLYHIMQQNLRIHPKDATLKQTKSSSTRMKNLMRSASSYYLSLRSISTKLLQAQDLTWSNINFTIGKTNILTNCWGEVVDMLILHSWFSMTFFIFSLNNFSLGSSWRNLCHFRS